MSTDNIHSCPERSVSDGLRVPTGIVRLYAERKQRDLIADRAGGGVASFPSSLGNPKSFLRPQPLQSL